MSGSAKKRREKAKRRVRSTNRRVAWEARLAEARKRDAEFDAAYPGLREQFGGGSEILRMVRLAYDAGIIRASTDGRPDAFNLREFIGSSGPGYTEMHHHAIAVRCSIYPDYDPFMPVGG